MARTSKQCLAVYRRWLVLNVALAVFLVLIVPPRWFAYGPHDAATVLPAVGALVGWWITFVFAWVSHDRIPRSAR
ncbi:hypothetical protein VSH64_25060 [Amycolatopsis rhabdoformis]|uniref:Uncharacterized protein n=1 Tax=Amycolatopsis rhabdoformis TaxID=1448059 RepID=A0ABZ1HX38_9PSEU|nr:hypothetical protein [Amycolatopsis rhabdoformis]WSE26148.1 hypothetical protein VSH64_25060 [Amycolatopsis rhabdoformis]